MTEAAGGGDQRPPLALVVEDEEAVRAFVQRVVVAEGYECLEAGSAEEALVTADRAERPLDLLVLDIMLPDSWGTRLVADLRARSPRLGVVLTSGFTGEDPVLGAGIGDRFPFLSKPFDVEDLRAAFTRARGEQREE